MARSIGREAIWEAALVAAITILQPGDLRAANRNTFWRYAMLRRHPSNEGFAATDTAFWHFASIVNILSHWAL